MLKILIVENEVAALRQITESCAAFFPEAIVVGSAASVELARILIEQKAPDILLLDVELDDGSAFDLLQLVSLSQIHVIFLTAHEKYAVQAFRMNAIDFLLKPILSTHFKEMVEKLRKAQGDRQSQWLLQQFLQNRQLPKKQQQLLLKDADNIHVVAPTDILYCQADGRYTTFHLSQNKITISQHLKLYEAILAPFDFFRCHHSYLINLEKITKVDKPMLQIILQEGHRIPLANRKKERFYETLKARSI